MTGPGAAETLNDGPPARIHEAMRHALLAPIMASAIVLLALPADAACFADYQAKRDAPLRLHYGTMQINGDCNPAAASQEAAGRLASAGWTLLQVIGTFGESGLAEREQSAGDYHLRY